MVSVSKMKIFGCHSLRQPIADGVVDQFFRGLQAKFEEDAFLVGLNGAFADVQLLTYLFCGQALGTKLDNLFLAIRKFFGNRD